MKKIFSLLALAIFTTTASQAALTATFQIDTAGGGTLSGTTYTQVLTGLNADGVTFDATLTVTSSGGDITQNTSGLGVAGNSSDLVNSGEFLTFGLAISNATGGTVNIDGFTEIDFNSLGSLDAAVLSQDNDINTAGDNFFSTTTGADTVDISGTLPAVFSAIADPGASNSFRIDDVTLQFTGTIIPEPTTTLLSLSIFPLLLLIRRRQRL